MQSLDDSKRSDAIERVRCNRNGLESKEKRYEIRKVGKKEREVRYGCRMVLASVAQGDDTMRDLGQNEILESSVGSEYARKAV
jgi:hypothetical protein